MDATVAANVAGVSLSPLFPPPTSPPFLPSASLLSPRHIFLLSTLVEFSPSLPPPLPLLRPSLFHPLSRLPALTSRPSGREYFFRKFPCTAMIVAAVAATRPTDFADLTNW